MPQPARYRHTLVPREAGIAGREAMPFAQELKCTRNPVSRSIDRYLEARARNCRRPVRRLVWTPVAKTCQPKKRATLAELRRQAPSFGICNSALPRANPGCRKQGACALRSRVLLHCPANRGQATPPEELV